MKAVIMAGGLGKRAREISAELPKPLIPIAGKPILQWEIECLISQGYREIILTVSYMAEKIEEYFGDGEKYGCKIQYFYEDVPLGNAGALFKMWESGELVGDFLLLNADTMFDIDFNRFVKKHRDNKALVTLFTHPNNHPYDSGIIITDDNGWVEQWLTKEEKRPAYYHNCVNAGVHCLSVEALKESGINPSEVGKIDADGNVIRVDLDRQVFKPLAGKRKMLSISSPEYVRDMGTPERFEQVQSDLCSGLIKARNLINRQKAVFLDRDGTINKYVGFLREIDDFVLIEGAAEGIRRLNKSGYLVIVVTNQPVIARGEVSVEQLNAIHNKMETLLGEEGAYIDALYYCPHHPEKGFDGEIAELKIDCDCRKPKPGLLLDAAKDFNIDLSESIMIGDGARDIEAGKNAGCKTILLIGEGSEEKENLDLGQDVIANNLLDAVFQILSW